MPPVAVLLEPETPERQHDSDLLLFRLSSCGRRACAQRARFPSHFHLLLLSRPLAGWAGEPQAGSGLSQVRGVAGGGGDNDRLSGQKIFIAYGEPELAEDIMHMILARTPNAPAVVKGLSLFVVPKFVASSDGSVGERNDVRCVSIEHKLGIKGSPTRELYFDDCEIPAARLVVVPNDGPSVLANDLTSCSTDPLAAFFTGKPIVSCTTTAAPAATATRSPTSLTPA